MAAKVGRGTGARYLATFSANPGSRNNVTKRNKGTTGTRAEAAASAEALGADGARRREFQSVVGRPRLQMS
jgi:hypothetical protein